MSTKEDILYRCRQVVQQLQEDLTNKIIDCTKKDQLIEKLKFEKNQILQKNQQFQKIMYELKEVNVILRSQLKKSENNQKMQSQVQRLSNQLNKTIVIIESKQTKIKQLENSLKQQIKCKQEIDKQLQLAMKDITVRIQNLEQQIKLKDQQNNRLLFVLSQQSKYNQKVQSFCNTCYVIKNNQKSNNKSNYDSILKTASTKKSLSISKQFVNKKYNQYEILSVNNRNNVLQSILNDSTNSFAHTIQNTFYLNKNTYPNRSKMVNDTIKKIEQKLSRINQKLTETEDQNISFLNNLQ